VLLHAGDQQVVGLLLDTLPSQDGPYCTFDHGLFGTGVEKAVDSFAGRDNSGREGV
jgi:hypothetical protein